MYKRQEKYYDYEYASSTLKVHNHLYEIDFFEGQRKIQTQYFSNENKLSNYEIAEIKYNEIDLNIHSATPTYDSDGDGIYSYRTYILDSSNYINNKKIANSLKTLFNLENLTLVLKCGVKGWHRSIPDLIYSMNNQGTIFHKEIEKNGKIKSRYIFEMNKKKWVKE